MLRLEGVVFRFGTAIEAPVSSSVEPACNRASRDAKRCGPRKGRVRTRPDCHIERAPIAIPAGVASPAFPWQPVKSQYGGRLNMILPVSLTAAAAAAFINLWLGIRIGQVRTSEKVSIGDGGNEKVIRRMRAQANFVEFTPFVLILIALIEMAAGTSTLLWAVMAVYMVARIAHALGMDGLPRGRAIGIILTLLIMTGLAGYAVYIAHSSDGKVIAPAEVIQAG